MANEIQYKFLDIDGVGVFKEEFDKVVNDAVGIKANKEHTHAISDVTDLVDTLNGKVPTSRKVNGKSLSADITLSASDVGAATPDNVSEAQSQANTYTDEKIASLLNNSTTAVDSIMELAKAMEDNEDAIAALEDIASGHADKDHTHTNYASSVEVTGAGNAVTTISQDGNKITAVKGSTFLTAHPTVSKVQDDTSTASPKHGETFTTVDNIIRDSNGHVTHINTKTVTLPSETTLSKGTDGTGATTLKHGDSFTVTMNTSVNGHKITDNKMTFTLPTTTATTSASGLMSAADKLKVDESASVDYVKGLMTWGTF